MQAGPHSDVVARLRAGDAAAFEAAFRRYYAQLCDYANRFLAAPDGAEEVVQDVFTNLWRSRASLQIATTLPGLPLRRGPRWHRPGSG
jgi:RNA polymerase sigma-70 factor (ECF subfamily)